MVVRNTRSLKKKLGDILVDVGIITHDQLKQALEIQHSRGGKLGAILQELNFCSEEVLLAFLGRQCGVSYVSISEYGNISPQVIRLVPESVVRNQTLIPLSCDDNVLTIAMSDPLNVFATDDLKQITGCEIKVVIASNQEITEAIDKYYGVGSSLEDGGDLKSSKSEPVADPKKPDEIPLTVTEDSADGFIADVLQAVLKSGASDAYFEIVNDDVRSYLRFEGVPETAVRVSRINPSQVLGRLRSLAGWKIGEDRDEGVIKTTIEDRDVIFRINVLLTASGWTVRIHWVNPLRINSNLIYLGMEKDLWEGFHSLLDRKKGLILISSPAANGLTTTYYSLLSALSNDKTRTLSVENVVECRLPEIQQVEVARPDRFSSAGAGLTHQSSGIVAFADMNTPQDAVALLEAVSGGSFGIVCLQARTSAEALARFVQMAGVGGWTTSLIEGILSQRLVRLLCPNCKTKTTVPMDTLLPAETGADRTSLAAGRQVDVYQPAGCAICGQTGYDGRSAVFEYFRMTESIRKKLVHGATSSEIERELVAEKQRTLKQAVVVKILAGLTSVDELRRISA